MDGWVGQGDEVSQRWIKYGVDEWMFAQNEIEAEIDYINGGTYHPYILRSYIGDIFAIYWWYIRVIFGWQKIPHGSKYFGDI